MRKALSLLVFAHFVLIICAEGESERVRLYGVPTRRGLVDNNDPNHLRAAAENAHRRIPFERLEPDKATSIFASVERNPLTRTTVDTTLPYTKAPVILDDILRKRRSPVIADFELSAKSLQTDEIRAERKESVAVGSNGSKAKILVVSEFDEDPFEVKETPIATIAKDSVSAMPETTTTSEPAVAVIDSDAQLVPKKRKSVRHLVANDRNSTIHKLRIKRSPSIIDSATENLDRSEFDKAETVEPTTSPEPQAIPRTTMKTPSQRLIKTPNTSNFVALDNQNSREVVEREEIRVVPKLIKKSTVAPSTTQAPTTTTSTSTPAPLPQKVAPTKPLNVIDIDAAEVAIPAVAKASQPAVVTKQSIGPEGPPVVWNEFIIPGEGRRILVKSIPASYFDNHSPPSFQHSGFVQSPRTKVPVVESEAIMARETQTTSVTSRPSTTLKVLVADKPQESFKQADFRDQVKSEDLQVLRIFEREGTTRTAFVTKPTTPAPQNALSGIPRIVKPTRTHEAAMKAAARDSPLPADVPVAKSDIPDPKQFARSPPRMIMLNSNGQNTKFRAQDFTDRDVPRSKPMSARFAEKMLFGK